MKGERFRRTFGPNQIIKVWLKSRIFEFIPYRYTDACITFAGSYMTNMNCSLDTTLFCIHNLISVHFIESFFFVLFICSDDPSTFIRKAVVVNIPLLGEPHSLTNLNYEQKSGALSSVDSWEVTHLEFSFV